MRTLRSLPLCACVLLLMACRPSGPRSRAVYLLLDTSGTHAGEVGKAKAITNYLLGTLESGDSLGLARIDSASFSERDVIARVTFDTRPSYSNQQKRAFRDALAMRSAAFCSAAFWMDEPLTFLSHEFGEVVRMPRR